MRWSPAAVAEEVAAAVVSHRADMLVTFDSHGVSGHVNHVDTHAGVRRAGAACTSAATCADGASARVRAHGASQALDCGARRCRAGWIATARRVGAGAPLLSTSRALARQFNRKRGTLGFALRGAASRPAARPPALAAGDATTGAALHGKSAHPAASRPCGGGSGCAARAAHRWPPAFRTLAPQPRSAAWRRSIAGRWPPVCIASDAGAAARALRCGLLRTIRRGRRERQWRV